MLLLLSNDDGIHSPLLVHLARALRSVPGWEVAVAAPAREQSWIGRAMSRYRPVDVAEATDLGPLSWAIDGTPSDCVNIALGHLLPRRPDLVVSGINIGFNTTVAMILCSGTVGAATEGASWGLPALALSLHVTHDAYESLRHPGQPLSPATAADLAHACERSIEFARRVAGTSQPGLRVHNVNFPIGVTATTPVVETEPESLEGGPLFAPDASMPGRFGFRYRDGRATPPPVATGDRSALARGAISHSVLDFHLLGRAAR